MKRVSLNPYRSPGVRLFSGEERGRLVAEAIADEHGREIVVEIPEDVWSLSFTFWRGFFSVLPQVEVVGAALHLADLDQWRPSPMKGQCSRRDYSTTDGTTPTR